MKLSSILRALGAASLVVLAATTVGAQSTTQSSSTAMNSAASTPWPAVPAGSYKLDIQLPERVMPAALTIKDSSGVPAATLLPAGEENAIPVTITIKSAELYVNGQAPKGLFEIVLLRQGDEITGRWSYGGDTGKLTGKVEK